MPGRPHYLREYRRLWRTLQKRHGDGEAAFHEAVGGNYEGEGKFQAALVLDHAPKGSFNLLDIGCGAGRAAYALRGEERITYIGTDILPELIEFAHNKAKRPDWHFEVVTGITLPVDDGWADMAICMSVFTHLTPQEIKHYLRLAARAIKPGGVIICSYLDPDEMRHKSAFRSAPLQWIGRLLGRDVMLRFTAKDALSAWLEEAGFKFEKAIAYDHARQHTMIGRRLEKESAS